MCRISLVMLEHSVLSVLLNQSRQTDKNMGRAMVDGFSGCLTLSLIFVYYMLTCIPTKDSIALSFITLW